MIAREARLMRRNKPRNLARRYAQPSLQRRAISNLEIHVQLLTYSVSFAVMSIVDNMCKFTKYFFQGS